MVIDTEMELVHEGDSTLVLKEGTQRYIDQLSQMDIEARKKAKRGDLNRFKIHYIDQIEKNIVNYIRDEINEELARKGQFIQSRVSLSIEDKHKDEVEADDDLETDSKPKVKREQS
jgi:DNA-dependent RNA polymerase auxiliary subunit epsilon